MDSDQAERRRRSRIWKRCAGTAVATVLAAMVAAPLGGGVARADTVQFPPLTYRGPDGPVIALIFKCRRETATRMACEMIGMSMQPSASAGEAPGTCLFDLGAESLVLERQGRSWVGHHTASHCQLRTTLVLSSIGDDKPPKGLRLNMSWSIGDTSKKCQESLALRVLQSTPVRAEWRAGELIRFKPKCTRFIMAPGKAPASAF